MISAIASCLKDDYDDGFRRLFSPEKVRIRRYSELFYSENMLGLHRHSRHLNCVGLLLWVGVVGLLLWICWLWLRLLSLGGLLGWRGIFDSPTFSEQ